MPKVTAMGKTITCEQGANLRRVLLEGGVALYNGNARVINCRGIGSCGTCAVAVEGQVAPPNWRDRTRRSLYPHSLTKKRLLACQTKVLGDIIVNKYSGFWGEGDEQLW